MEVVIRFLYDATSKQKEITRIINFTELTGSYNGINLKDDSEWKTTVKERKIEKKLPRTGC